MKYISLLVLVAILSISWRVFHTVLWPSYTYAQTWWLAADQEFAKAVARMYSYWLTKYPDVASFRWSDIVIREQAAKFYSQFAVNVLYQVIDMTKYCEFKDITAADPSLRNAMLTSCLLWLFHGKDGNFMPLKDLSKAEALAVLVRTIDKKQDESTVPWYKNYHSRALKLWLTKQKSLDGLEQSVSRYELALLLFRASQMKK
jgi:hypothetical protein